MQTSNRIVKGQSGIGTSKSAYNKMLQKRSSELLRCPECMDQMTLNEYVHEHVVHVHGWDPRLECVFCSDRLKWVSSRKRDFEHLNACLWTFMDVNSVRDVEEEEPMDVTFEPCQECITFRSRPRDMWGRSKDRLSEYVHFYDSVFENPDEYLPLSTLRWTEQSGLGNDVHGMVQRYLIGDLGWYHLMVHHQNFDNFVKSMDELKDEFFLLPFWCLCDGLTPNRQTHRHMLLACKDEERFQKVWISRVKCPIGHQKKSKYGKRIEDAFHLIRTIQYVSQRKSSCDGKHIIDVVDDNHFKYAHFHINRPLSEHAIVVLCTMIEGGMERLWREQLQHKKVSRWFRHVQMIRDRYSHAKYAVPIGVTGFKFLNCVLPLSVEDKTTGQWTKDGWVQRDEMYVLSPRQQNVMGQIKEVAIELSEMERRTCEGRCRKIESKVKELQSKWSELHTKYTDLQTHSQARIAELQTHYNHVQSNYIYLQSCYADSQAKMAKLQSKVTELQLNVADAHTKWAEMQTNHTDLRQKLEALKDAVVNVTSEDIELKMKFIREILAEL